MASDSARKGSSLRRLAITPVRVAGAGLLAVAIAMIVSAAVAVIDGGGAAAGG